MAMKCIFRSCGREMVYFPDEDRYSCKCGVEVTGFDLHFRLGRKEYKYMRNKRCRVCGSKDIALEITDLEGWRYFWCREHESEARK